MVEIAPGRFEAVQRWSDSVRVGSGMIRTQILFEWGRS